MGKQHKDTNPSTLPRFTDVPAEGIKPWWRYTTTVGGSSFDVNYAHVALHYQALEYGLSTQNKWESGKFQFENKSKAEILALIRDESLALEGKLITFDDDKFVLVWPTTLFQVEFDRFENTGNIGLYSTDHKLYAKLLEIANKYLNTKQPPEGKVYVLLPSPGGLNCESIGLGAIPLIRENYREEVLQGYDSVVKDLQSKDPLGRLSIFDGSPGTGKTYLIRALLSDLPDLKFLILPSNMVSSLSGPDILSSLIDASGDNYSNQPASIDDFLIGKPSNDNQMERVKMPLVLIIEDADSCLSSRGSDNIGAISVLLNLTDGIIGNLLDLRIIATTNIELTDIDPAILRQGRLSQRVEVGMVNSIQAENIYKRLGGNKDIKWDSKKFYPLSDLYALAKGDSRQEAVYSKKTNNKRKVGFSNE